MGRKSRPGFAAYRNKEDSLGFARDGQNLPHKSEYFGYAPSAPPTNRPLQLVGGGNTGTRGRRSSAKDHQGCSKPVRDKVSTAVRGRVARVIAIFVITLSGSPAELEGRGFSLVVDHLAGVRAPMLISGFPSRRPGFGPPLTAFDPSNSGHDPVEPARKSGRCTPSGSGASRYRVAKPVMEPLRATKCGS